MQGYLKYKETDEELYEMNLDFKQKFNTFNHNAENIPIDNNMKKAKKSKIISCKRLLAYIIHFLIQAYLKIVVQIKKWFNIVTIKEIYSGLIFILPFSEYECLAEENEDVKKLTKKFKQKLKQQHIKKQLKKSIPKIKKLMKEYQISTLILSDELQKNSTFIKSFQSDRILQKEVHLLDEKEMMPYLIKEIIEYILQKQGRNIELEDLYVIIKQEYSEYKESIAFLTQYFKTINIVTPNLKSYQKLANQLEKEYQAIITVTNNKKKSLRKAKWIVNFDMPAEEIKKYTIYQKSTIIYIERNDIYKGNAFDGIHICKAGIDVSQEIKDFFMKQHLWKQFSITILYESTLINKRNFREIKEQMKKDKVKIAKLYGSRGILEEEEFRRVE